MRERGGERERGKREGVRGVREREGGGRERERERGRGREREREG